MKVLHLSNEMAWRGGENQIRLLTEGLKAHNVESVVAFPKGSKALEVFKNVTETIELPSRAAYDPRSILRLIKYCRTHAVDILDAHSSGGMSLALSVKKRLPHLKLVVHRRTAFSIKKNWLSQNKYFNSDVNQYVCISVAIAQILNEYGLQKNKITVVKSAIDERNYLPTQWPISREEWRSKLNINDQDVVLGCASALTEEKGHDTIIRACKELQNKNISFKCIFAGEGELEQALKNEAHLLQLDQNIIFTGFIKDIYGFLCALDILVLPSRAEGLGTILLEGAFAGCTLVGSRVGGIPEVIRHNETGLLFEVDKEHELALCLEQLITDKNLRLKLSLALKDHVRREFSLQNMVLGNFEVYKKLF